MKTILRWGMGASAATVALGLLAVTGSAQQTPPAAKAPAATPAPAAKPPAAKPDAKKPEKKASACAGLEQAACAANAECGWVAASVDAKTGKEKRKAYCRKKPAAPAKKAAAAAKPAAPAASPAAPAAPKKQ